jgi:hypothetical protein
MLRYALSLVVVALIFQGNIPAGAAEDNPVLRTMMREVIKKELSARDSKEKGWRQGNTWLWLENPTANLAADISSLTLEGGRFNIEGRASGIVAFHHKVDLLVGSKTYSGQALVYFSFKASAQAGEQLTGARVSIGRLEIHDLHLHGAAVRPFQGIVEEAVNLTLKNKKHDIETRLEQALNRVNIAGRFPIGSARTGSQRQ